MRLCAVCWLKTTVLPGFVRSSLEVRVEIKPVSTPGVGDALWPCGCRSFDLDFGLRCGQAASAERGLEPRSRRALSRRSGSVVAGVGSRAEGSRNTLYQLPYAGDVWAGPACAAEATGRARGLRAGEGD